MTDKIQIGNIGNYYGNLSVKEDNGKFFWSIGNHKGESWEQIPRYLYNALRKFDRGKGAEMEYTILMWRGRLDLMMSVGELLKDGWKPQGGISVSVDNKGDEWLYQAMIKEAGE